MAKRYGINARGGLASAWGTDEGAVVLAKDYDYALTLLSRALPMLNPAIAGDLMRNISEVLRSANT